MFQVDGLEIYDVLRAAVEANFSYGRPGTNSTGIPTLTVYLSNKVFSSDNRLLMMGRYGACRVNKMLLLYYQFVP